MKFFGAFKIFFGISDCRNSDKKTLSTGAKILSRLLKRKAILVYLILSVKHFMLGPQKTPRLKKLKFCFFCLNIADGEMLLLILQLLLLLLLLRPPLLLLPLCCCRWCCCCCYCCCCCCCRRCCCCSHCLAFRGGQSYEARVQFHLRSHFVRN